MKLLLNTHIWLWYLFGDSHLSNNLIKTIEDEIFKINLFISSYSFNFFIVGVNGVIVNL